MKKLHTSLLFAIAATLPMSVAFAEGADAKFSKMDADSNGQVSQSESRTAGEQMFTELDSDGDGSVTSAEIDAWKASKGKDHHADGMSAADMIAKVDTDGDSRISRQEHTAAGEKMFTESDANSDGNIDMAEFEAAKDRKHDN